MAGLAENEIAEIEWLPRPAASEVRRLLREYLLNLDHGVDSVRILLVEHLRAALDLGMRRQAAQVSEALRLFLAIYPVYTRPAGWRGSPWPDVRWHPLGKLSPAAEQASG